MFSVKVKVRRVTGRSTEWNSSLGFVEILSRHCINITCIFFIGCNYTLLVNAKCHISPKWRFTRISKILITKDYDIATPLTRTGIDGTYLTPS